MNHRYCNSRYKTIRRASREINVGNVSVGGNNPIRIQSMTTTNAQDVDATVKQTISLVNAGCEIVRITAPNKAAAEALKDVRAKLDAQNIHVPLVADIHFLPSAAMVAVEHVEKIRVNPGNYADRKKFATREYSDSQYDEELDRIHETFSPLVLRAKELGRAMRIGTNHGSLSDRIMNRYGDTPLGMVESALEFLRIAESHSYYNIALSMKASNPKVMIAAYRMLVERMEQESMFYPLHLGVTEAGDGEDGRIKSAIGIGSLLADGLGDTIRVSLTEDPEFEIPVADALAKKVMTLWDQEDGDERRDQDAIDPYDFNKRAIDAIEISSRTLVGPDSPPRVILNTHQAVSEAIDSTEDSLKNIQNKLVDTPIEGIFLKANNQEDLDTLTQLGTNDTSSYEFLVIELSKNLDFSELPKTRSSVAFLKDFSLSNLTELKSFLNSCEEANATPIISLEHKDVSKFREILRDSKTIITLSSNETTSDHAIGRYRQLFDSLKAADINAPVWLRNTSSSSIKEDVSFLNRLLEASILTGSLLCDGLGDIVSIETEKDFTTSIKLTYNVLQGAGARITKTEYVACPSCGRTLFDLQSTTQRIRAQTGHLKGVKIAIMGCIVNGPGEMADADFGYVGGAPGKINLYVGKECVQYNIPAADADQRLIDLIKEHDKWTDVPTEISSVS
ncbi:(E)-4-hydroxy-3-methylbut-2-enyl-diphosphate synthase [Puniceicoccaceae bacterium K14]|nr:(E)-4-hydroxy-3-methylbut-2-enyl-diphosphate synthase [Puniceicoccaceae bacterium K14]